MDTKRNRQEPSLAIPNQEILTSRQQEGNEQQDVDRLTCSPQTASCDCPSHGHNAQLV